MTVWCRASTWTIGVLGVIAVSTGHAALHLAMLLIGAGPGDEIITPSFNNVADFQAIAAVGASPVFCDAEMNVRACTMACTDPVHPSLRQHQSLRSGDTMGATAPALGAVASNLSSSAVMAIVTPAAVRRGRPIRESVAIGGVVLPRCALEPRGQGTRFGSPAGSEDAAVGVRPEEDMLSSFERCGLRRGGR